MTFDSWLKKYDVKWGVADRRCIKASIHSTTGVAIVTGEGITIYDACSHLADLASLPPPPPRTNARGRRDS
jgi:hypothetical protein